jgi:hypothetical protein
VYVTIPMSWGLHQLPHDYYRFTNAGIVHLLDSTGFAVDTIEPIGGLFTLIAARIADYLHSTFIDPPLAQLRLDRGRLRAGALLLSVYNLIAMALGALLDRTSRADMIGWAILATKPDCAADMTAPAGLAHKR